MKNKLLILIICGIFIILSLNIVFSYDSFPNNSTTGGFFVIIKADAINTTSNFLVNDCNITQIDDDLWVLFANSGDYEQRRSNNNN